MNHTLDSFVPMRGRIIEIKDLTPLERLYTINIGKWPEHMPGQIYATHVPGRGEAPISATSYGRPHLRLAIRCASGGEKPHTSPIGGVTHAIHKMKVGDQLGIRGPFGNGYPMEELKGRDVILAMTGIGIFPVWSAVEFVLSHREEFGRLFVYFGNRTAELFYPEELAALERVSDTTVGIAISRDPAWKGHKGHITQFIKNTKYDTSRTSVIMCGPARMFQDICEILTRQGVEPRHIHMSLERKMQCNGLGTCGHCRINHTLVCKDGPVYNYAWIIEENLWEAFK